jgi:hypothetical protein
VQEVAVVEGWVKMFISFVATANRRPHQAARQHADEPAPTMHGSHASRAASNAHQGRKWKEEEKAVLR